MESEAGWVTMCVLPLHADSGNTEPRMQMQMQLQSKEFVAKQQRWLLFLRHSAKCQAAEGQCTYGQSCTVAKQLWHHILTCADPNCEYPRQVPNSCSAVSICPEVVVCSSLVL
jgi:hypothetical protein